MTKRKDRLKAMFSGAPAGEPIAAAEPTPRTRSAALGGLETKSSTPDTPAGASPPSPAAAPVDTSSVEAPSPALSDAPVLSASHRPRSASGAVKAMGLSLGQMAEDMKKTTGERVVKLDPAHIEASPVTDRLTTDEMLDEGFTALKESLRDHGQQVPVLVRPHPDEAKRAAGWFQAAYGHRRIRAARDLGMEVSALVKDLTDEALVLAQGKENAERRDLSFIERAFFAQALIDGGFSRKTVEQALSIHKTEMTRFLQVADKVPYHIAKNIGPAPKIGRPRWMQLGAMLEAEAAQAIAQDEITSDGFRAADSDTRFQRLFERLERRKAKKPKPRVVKSEAGSPLAEVKGRVVTLDKAAPEPFVDYLAERLPALLAEFEKGSAETGETS